MVRIPVESSDVLSIGYDPENMTMEVEFMTKAVYLYFDVPLSFFQEFLAAPSKGQFANYVLKRSGLAYDRVA